MRKNSGFTIIELMVAVTVLGILLGFGIPSFQTMLQNNRMTSQINNFITSLLLARSEAIKGNRIVYLCASTAGTACDGANWEEGWMTYIDGNNDGAYSATSACTTANFDCILTVNAALQGGNTLRGSALTLPNDITTSIGYTPTGESDKNGVFTVCDPRGDSNHKGIRVSPTGRPKSISDHSDSRLAACP